MNIRPMSTPADWQDSVADWAVSHPLRMRDRDTLPTPLLIEEPRAWANTEAAVHLVQDCSACSGACHAPQACQQSDQTQPHRRQRWLTAALAIGLGAVIAAVCMVGYLKVPT